MRDSILILGGGGFIGTRLAAMMTALGLRPALLGHGLDDKISEQLLQRRGSVEDSTLLAELLDACSAVVYLANVTTPGASAREPSLEVTGNLLPLARFLEVAQSRDPRPLVFLSSAGTVYGECADAIEESAPPRPRSYHGAGKAAAEALLHVFATNAAWPTTVLRPTNVYGPGQLPVKGFGIVPTIFRHMLEQRTFEVWGDGSAVRDYLFVDDVCRLIMCALQRPPPRFSVYNAGAGNAVSVLELIGLCELAAGKRLETRRRPARMVDVPRVVPSLVAARDAFGWGATTSLADGLERTWRWICDSGAPA